MSIDRFSLLSEDNEKYYNFTELACQLNEPEDGVAPTDSRLRRDQRLMEEGLWIEANSEKVRLEEKQRVARRAREQEAERMAAQGKPRAFFLIFIIINGTAPLRFSSQVAFKELGF